MPRIYQSDNDPLDFCTDHFPDETAAELEYGDESRTGSGPDGRGNCFTYDADHPPYEDDPSMYRCTICHAPLTADDNSWNYQG
jgi:hypothetical protein